MLGKFIVLFGLCVLPFAAAEEQTCNNRPDCPKAIAFFRDLQSALQKNDRPTIAGMIDYPVRTSLQKKSVKVRNPQQLLAHFDEIFDEGVRCTILAATEKDVWGNWQGFTVDGGAVWFDGIVPAGGKHDANAPDDWQKHPMKIKTINNEGDYACAAQTSGGKASSGK
jgi:hypothetical protein